MIGTETETFRGYGKIGEISGQTAVECRFGGEVETVLSAHASATLLSAEAGNGEVHYTGRVHFSIVYESGEKKVCRAEKGVEFSAKATSDACCPAFTPRVKLQTENVSVRREGASVYLTALLGADVTLYGEKSFEYLTDGELVLKRESFPFTAAHLCGGAAEADDEFETDFIGDILLHAETVNLSDVHCETGSLVLEGEVNLGILALKGETSLVSFERLVPFRVEIPCEAAQAGRNAEGQVCVSDIVLHADADEEQGKCKIVAELTLNAEGCVYEETQIDGIADAFSLTHAVELSFADATCAGVGEAVKLTERVSGKAALSSPVDFSDVFQAVTLQRAEANLITGDEKRLEGVAMATLLVLGADGVHRGVELSLPFSLPVQAEGDCAVSVLACGMSARQRQEGEVEAEATLKIVLTPKKKWSIRPLAAVEEKEPLVLSDSAVSVYIPRAGDGLWELAKSLKKPPEDVSASNPDIEFPIKKGQRVIIYRKKSLL